MGGSISLLNDVDVKIFECTWASYEQGGSLMAHCLKHMGSVFGTILVIQCGA